MSNTDTTPYGWDHFQSLLADFFASREDAPPVSFPELWDDGSAVPADSPFEAESPAPVQVSSPMATHLPVPMATAVSSPVPAQDSSSLPVPSNETAEHAGPSTETSLSIPASTSEFTSQSELPAWGPHRNGRGTNRTSPYPQMIGRIGPLSTLRVPSDRVMAQSSAEVIAEASHMVEGFGPAVDHDDRNTDDEIIFGEEWSTEDENEGSELEEGQINQDGDEEEDPKDEAEEGSDSGDDGDDDDDDDDCDYRDGDGDEDDSTSDSDSAESESSDSFYSSDNEEGWHNADKVDNHDHDHTEAASGPATGSEEEDSDSESESSNSSDGDDPVEAYTEAQAEPEAEAEGLTDVSSDSYETSSVVSSHTLSEALEEWESRLADSKRKYSGGEDTLHKRARFGSPW